MKNSSLQIVVQCGVTLHLQAVAAMASSSSSSSSPQKIDFVDAHGSTFQADGKFLSHALAGCCRGDFDVPRIVLLVSCM